MTEVIALELNEINLDFAQIYCQKGKLPNLNALLRAHGYSETYSEQSYDEWEPWIQWVTAHSGMTLAEHGVFRLGDIVHTEIDQIWEKLERQGLKVGAFSPMNAANRLQNPAFFLPDPWTDTSLSAPPAMKQVYTAIAKAVDANASGKISAGSLIALGLGLARFARPKNYFRYLRLAFPSIGRPWLRATFLDLFLGDLFLHLMKTTRPQFASIFLNAAAHIQHHYLLSSQAYAGDVRNPTWYVPAGEDPILAVYEVYDQLIGDLQAAFPDARLLIATGLHQVPHEAQTYYWRLLDHAKFLQQIGLSFQEAQPRMSRDFLIVCQDNDEAMRNEAILLSAKADDGQALFVVDNRGCDLFVELVYARDIAHASGWIVGNRRFEGLRSQVAFVAVKNGQHDGIGYFIDTGTAPSPELCRFALSELPNRIATACGLESQSSPRGRRTSVSALESLGAS